MSEVRIERVMKAYGAAYAINDVSLTIREGEFVTLLGPSGCGKTTTLRMVAGFAHPDSGEIFIGGKRATHLPANRRNTAMVFQNFALFPHLTVAQNTGFGLSVRNVGKVELASRVEAVLQLVQLASMADRLPRQLSGGQQQRVALARAIVIRPDVLLFDEPLSALDLKLRQELQVQIRQVQQALGITALYVTHDQGEALRMSDRVAVMNHGRIVQCDVPQAIYRRPATAFVAGFIGRTNLLHVRVTGLDPAENSYTVAAEFGTFRVSIDPNSPRFGVGDSAWLGFRPEAVCLGAAHENHIAGTICNVAYSGSIWNVAVDGPSGQIALESPYCDQPPANGEAVTVSWRREDCFLLPPETADAEHVDSKR